ncbi:MAG: acyltransferase [Candidatus Saccharibacteria bacterium]|nr:acyltransferase [Rhodoferax sp.]
MNAGLNLLRFFLAFNVVIFHLWNSAAPGSGPAAVLGFFFVSGYLITQIVREVYAAPGRAADFVLNRALRIYPQYLMALGLGLLAINSFPAVASHINSYMRWPQTSAEWWPQLAIFGQGRSTVRVLPATWTLSTELYFYALIGLVTAQSKKASLALCMVSLPVGALCAAKVLPFDFYGSPIGNGFVFSLGSVAYFYRYAVPIRAPVFALACAAYLAHVYAIPSLEKSDLDSANLAGSLLPFWILLLYFIQHPVNVSGRPVVVRISHLLGKIAYPLFLLHWTVCVVMSAWLFHGLSSADMHSAWESGRYFAVMLVASIGCSLVFYSLIDRPVEHVRQQIRGWVRGA